MRAVNQDGTVQCDADGAGTGDITGVTDGTGLSGGGASGDVSLAVAFGGSGAAGTAARSDHTHATAATDSTAVGNSAMAANTGAWNTAVGSRALQFNVAGTAHTAVGDEVMWTTDGGSENTAIGHASMRLLVGSYNTAVGSQTLKFIQGNSNIGIGHFAGDWTNAGDNNIYIANPGKPGFGDESNRIRIGFGHVATFIQGIRGSTTGVNDAVPVLIDSQGQLETASSSRRFKDDIADMGGLAEGLQRLRPVQFRYRQPFADGSTPVQYGLIAEEVAEVYPELVARSADGSIETVKYHVLPTLLLAEVQRLERERAALARELVELRALVEGMSQK